MEPKRPNTIEVNTTSHEHTHFLAGVQLIRQANEKYKVPSENWPSPTRHRIGTSNDRYYAEIWTDGMDWQRNYWCLEAVNYSPPACSPFLRFADYSEENKFNNYDLNKMLEALLYFRRNEIWIRHNDWRCIYGDEVWGFLKYNLGSAKNSWVDCSYAHNSQPLVKFQIMHDFLPNWVNHLGTK